MKYLTNAFSLNMLADFNVAINVREISLDEAKGHLDAKSVVGHPDTAAIYSGLFGREVACNRETVALHKGDVLVVGQYRGPRLPEGVKTLPAGATIQWLLVTIS